jgi:hypothetical protein
MELVALCQFITIALLLDDGIDYLATLLPPPPT